MVTSLSPERATLSESRYPGVLLQLQALSSSIKHVDGVSKCAGCKKPG
jgi:hypothetical protein